MEFFRDYEDKTVGLYINENDSTPLDELMDWLLDQLKVRDVKICMD